MVISKIAKDPVLNDLAHRVRRRGGVVGATGLWGSSAPALAAHVRHATGRPILYITAHLEEADDALEDLEFFGGRRCTLLPAWETLPGEGGASGEIASERIRVCSILFEARDRGESSAPPAIVAPIQALMQPVPTPATLVRNMLTIETGSKADVETLVAWLADRGFTRLDRVEAPGDFARRGDILDVFAPGESDPWRIVFDVDVIESIRRFDASDQRSTDAEQHVTIAMMPQTVNTESDEYTSLTRLLSEKWLVVLDNPIEVQEMGRLYADRLGAPGQIFDVTTILKTIDRFDQLHVARIGGMALPQDDVFHFQVSSVARFEGRRREAVAELCHAAQENDLYVVCENHAQQQRLHELITEQAGEIPPNISMPIGMVHRGFEWPACRTIVMAHHQVFGRELQRRRIRRMHAAKPLESWLDLQSGDFVVHTTHGIARFRGLRTMTKEGTSTTEEFLTLEFADQAVLHVPLTQIDLVQKYIGVGTARPALSKLGGTRWKRTKERVTESVAELADSLLRIQAARVEKGGISYPGDTQWQQEFEASFVYTETEDQLSAAAEIKRDLALPRAMDRLLCGDVGFGKTELAMRAAFKVMEYGKQVAVLVPTTVLADQHFRTFSERFAEYPFEIGCLSRFRTRKEQQVLIERAKRGQIDLLIGTHRLLSKDVHFANLGLVIIDEEQRFGVEHKERLKHLRETVEVLTMTATPIPRTLHMSMIGLRDISSLATPPVDRRSIVTEVQTFDPDHIRSAILRELNRDGQVFFLHNFVQSIESMAERIAQMVPEARVTMGHGQMKERQLSRVMRTFVGREADVLVCTTIIESGIDIPTANTIFINRADRFGLAELHQLRGRVGRSHHRAYCYPLLDPSRPVTDKAARRLKAIEEFSELGAGFRIAMRDLEIRGAGNILGPEQSGHIAAVGYEMYCQLLDRVVRSMRGEPDPVPAKVHLELDIAAHVPHSYIPIARARIDVYRRIVACQTLEDLAQAQTDLVDMYGTYPKPVEALFELTELRILARRWKIESIMLQRPDVVFRSADLNVVEPLFADAPGTVRTPDGRSIHVRMPPAYLEPETLTAVLRRWLSRERAANARCGTGA